MSIVWSIFPPALYIHTHGRRCKVRSTHICTILLCISAFTEEICAKQKKEGERESKLAEANVGNVRNYQFKKKENWMLRREEHQRSPMDFNAFSFLFLLRQKMLSAAPFRICVNGTLYGIHAMNRFYNHFISNNKFRICSLYMSHLDYACHNTCAISNTSHLIHHNICYSLWMYWWTPIHACSNT